MMADTILALPSDRAAMIAGNGALVDGGCHNTCRR